MWAENENVIRNAKSQRKKVLKESRINGQKLRVNKVGNHEGILVFSQAASLSSEVIF